MRVCVCVRMRVCVCVCVLLLMPKLTNAIINQGQVCSDPNGFQDLGFSVWDLGNDRDCRTKQPSSIQLYQYYNNTMVTLELPSDRDQTHKSSLLTEIASFHFPPPPSLTCTVSGSVIKFAINCTCGNEACHTCEWVMSHMWMSHVTHGNESYHIIHVKCDWTRH